MKRVLNKKSKRKDAIINSFAIDEKIKKLQGGSESDEDLKDFEQTRK